MSEAATEKRGSEAQRVRELVDEHPRPGLFGLEVAFVHPDATGGVLAELVSRG